ncbi:MAG: PQQ-binding-like beta-propeller repeat protein, partial [Verrucomicrobiae bacterium]|nr:PQQ-binding-like beta-propeller repeat protein [Verrucomicrobiae bacterium]
VGDLLIFTTDSYEEPVVTALNKKTGDIVWRTTRSHKVKNHFSFGTPLVIENGGRTEVVSAGSGMIGGYDPETGKELWRVTYPMGFSISNRPVYEDGLLYFSTGFQRPMFFAVRMDGALGDITESHVVWEYRKSMPKTPSPNYVNGSVITLEDDGRLQSFDAKTGEHQWLENLKGKFAASPVQIGDVLYLINEEGRCYILQVNDQACKILNEIDMGEQALASPAIVDNTIYLRTQPHLWKIAN